MKPTHPSPLLAALDSDARALKVLQAAFWMARKEDRPWMAVHIEVPERESLEEMDQARLWLQEALSLGATILWIQAPTLGTGLYEALHTQGATTLLMGKRPSHWFWDRLALPPHQELRKRLPGLCIEMISVEPGLPVQPWLPPPSRRLGALFATIGVLASITGLCAILPFNHPLPAIFGLFLLGTVTLSTYWGRLAGFLAYLVSVGLFPLLSRAEPLLSLWVSFGIVLGAGQLAVSLSQDYRMRMRQAQKRSTLLATVLLFTRHLSRATHPEEVMQILERLSEGLLHRKVRLVDVQDCTGQPPGIQAPVWDLPVSQPGEDWAYLNASPGGVLAVSLAPGPISIHAWELLQAIAVQVTLAMERVTWMQRAQRTQVENEAERVRSNLLSSISHDLRTPLAAIHGAASSLLVVQESPVAFDASTTRDLLTMITEESQRLTELLTKLLDLTRLENGTLTAKKQWQCLQEIASSAWERTTMGKDDVLNLPEDLPLIEADGVLLEQLLINLLENAKRHAPASPVTLAAWARENSLELQIADHGPGIPEEELERVFQKFYRRTQGEGGTGLGLAICDAIARVHGGRIWAEQVEPGPGVAFRVSLPGPFRQLKAFRLRGALPHFKAWTSRLRSSDVRHYKRARKES